MIFRKLVIIWVFLALVFSFAGTTVFAQDGNTQLVPKEEINPNAGTRYLVKRLKEKLILFLKFDQESRISYIQTLLDKRLSELAYISDNKNTAFIETTSSRYESTAGQLTEALIKFNNPAKEKDAKEKFANHLEILSKIQTNFSPTTAEWRFIENDINSLRIYSQQISNP